MFDGCRCQPPLCTAHVCGVTHFKLCETADFISSTVPNIFAHCASRWVSGKCSSFTPRAFVAILVILGACWEGRINTCFCYFPFAEGKAMVKGQWGCRIYFGSCGVDILWCPEDLSRIPPSSVCFSCFCILNHFRFLALLASVTRCSLGLDSRGSRGGRTSHN